MKLKRKTIVGLGGFMLLAISSSQTARADYPSTVISQGPAGYYRLNETVQPSVSSATNSGSLGASANGGFVGLPSLNLAGPFAGSVAIGLDGTSQYINTPWVDGLNTPSFTFELWANPALVPNFAYLASSIEANSPRSGWYLAQDNGSTFGLGSAWVVRMFNTNAATQTITLSAPVSAANEWVHLVLTYDGTTASLYTNGVLASSGITTTNLAGLGYIPNVDAPFTVGIRSSLNFPWPGEVAEAAMYSSALSPSRIAAHYSAATSAPASYASTVLADAPLLYDRYQAPVQPIAANSGTLGSAGNGLYLADAVAGAPGPNPPPYPGFASGNKAPAFDAGGGAVRLPTFNFNTNTITISGWVNATNLPELAGAGIVVCDSGTTGAGLIIDGTFGGLGLGYYWNNDANTYGISFNQDLGLPLLPDSDWAYVALVVQPTEAEIYIATTNAPTDGLSLSPSVSFYSATNYYSHVIQAFDGPTLIGTDAGSPTYSFNGAIDEVAIWDRSLGSGDLYSQFASAVGGLAPIVFSGPDSPDQPIVVGDTLTLPVNAGGTPNLSYQWRLNGTPIPAPLGTNAVYTKPNFSIAADSGNYDVIITNDFGSVISGVAVVSGQVGTAPVIVTGPVGGTIYPGGSLSLSVVATGGGLAYQWSTNGTPIPGATKSTYSVAGVTTADSGSYSVSVTNTLGSKTAGPVVVTVPTLTPGTYAAVVDADAPVAWWRLDDASATNGALLADAMGGHSGTYTNFGGLTVGNPGVVSPLGSLAGSSISFNGDGSYGAIPYFSALSGQKFTLELWAKQNSVVSGVTAASSFDSTPGGFGIAAESYWQGLNAGGSFGSAPGTTAGYDPTIRAGQWTHIVILFNPGGNATYPWQVYVNGQTDGYIWSGGSTLNNSQPFIIGGTGTGLASILKNYFVGYVDEVAFYNKLLSSTQIQAHEAAAYFGVPPTFSVQPLSQTAIAGDNITFSAAAVGAPPISLQWQKNGLDLPGQTNGTYTVTSVPYSASIDTYTAVATNAFGSAVSSGATITVYPPPTFANLTNGLVLHLAFDGDYTDSSGHNNDATPVASPTIVPGVIGSGAVDYSTDTTNSIYNYLTLGTPADLSFGSSVSFSVAYWVKLTPGELSGDLPFLGSAAGSANGFGIILAPSYKLGGWQWTLNDNVNNVAAQGADNSINDGNWHSLVHTFDRTANGITYLDGVQVSSVPISGLGSIDTGLAFSIGQDPTGTYGESGTASLDDMGIWRRVLSDIEARSIYYAGHGSGKSFTSPGTVSVYSSKLSNGNLGISWDTGTLKQANSITGPWTTVPGATPPFYQVTPSGTGTFYRVAP